MKSTNLVPLVSELEMHPLPGILLLGYGVIQTGGMGLSLWTADKETSKLSVSEHPLPLSPRHNHPTVRGLDNTLPLPKRLGEWISLGKDHIKTGT